jgi:hypothetical protein
MRTRDEGEPPPLFGPSRVFRCLEAWRYRGWLTTTLIVVEMVGVLALDELGVDLPYWLVGLIAAVFIFGTFGITELLLRRQVRREGLKHETEPRPPD